MFKYVIPVLGMGLALFADEYRMIKDIPYYDSGFKGSGNMEYRNEICKLDLYYPSDRPNFTTVVWLHGGGLSGGNKAVPPTLQNAGIAVAAVNYRLSSDKAKCPDYLEDAAAATAWVIRNIERYGGSSRSVYVSGASAGAYLSAMLGLDERYLQLFGLKPLDLAGVMPISGQMSTHTQVCNERRGVRGMKPDVPRIVDEYAPLYHVRKETPPLFFYVGDSALDWPGRTEENAYIVSLLKRICGNPQVEYYELKGFNHGDVYPAAQLLMLKAIRNIENDRLKKIIPVAKTVKAFQNFTDPVRIDGDSGEEPWLKAEFHPLVGRLYLGIYSEADPQNRLYAVIRTCGVERR